MNLEQHVTHPTIRRIFEHYEAAQQGKHRPHLGGSQIGNPCKRALWYQFRWCLAPSHEGRILRLFETGNREEDRIVANLRAVGVTVWDRDSETGRQISFTEHGGHFALSLDGVGQGFEESSAPHVLEFKTMGKKAFADVTRKGVKESKPVYWAQMQVGMYLADLDRAYFIAVEKDTDAIYGERVKLDVAEAMSLIAKAGEVIFAAHPPERIASDASDFRCRFCDYRDVCHGEKIPEVNCRTCCHVTPERDGTWTCELHGRDTTGEACADHLFIPSAMPPRYEFDDAGTEWVTYIDRDTGEVIRNGGNSRDL